jgi:type I restriction enzyme, S subunit
MKLQPYQDYKESSVEWLGKVPAHWEVKRFKHAATLMTRKSDGDEQAVALENIESWTGRYLSTDSEFEGDGVHFERGDILFGKLRPYLAKVLLAEFNGAAVGDFHVFRPSSGVDSRFTRHLVLCEWFISLMDGSTFGAKMPRVSWEFMGNTIVPIPPLEEQQAIADFLDRKTAQIDELIAKKEELLRKLDEKRSVLISRTVTRGLPADIAREFGLEPHTRFKDSGIEWLGEVPEGWVVKKLKFVLPKLYSGVSVNSGNAPADQDSFGVLKTSCVYGNRFLPEENKQVLDEEVERVSCPVTKDSLIISRMNTPDLVGNCGYVELDYQNLFLPDRLWIARFEASGVMSGKYAWYLISSDALVKLTGALATGTSGSMKNLSQESFLNISVAIPNVVEQIAIAEYLDRETAKIDHLKERVKQVINRLREYRVASIAAAVSGKLQYS